MSFSALSPVQIEPSRLREFENILKREGFWNAGLFQFWKAGQLYGYVRTLGNNLEWHVRAFRNGALDSEVEYSRWSRMHLSYPPMSYTQPLLDLLQRHGLLPFGRFAGWGNGLRMPDILGWQRRRQNFL
jgi:hypothetical protein